jgi:hypothetical protein
VSSTFVAIILAGVQAMRLSSGIQTAFHGWKATCEDVLLEPAVDRNPTRIPHKAAKNNRYWGFVGPPAFEPATISIRPLLTEVYVEFTPVGATDNPCTTREPPLDSRECCYGVLGPNADQYQMLTMMFGSVFLACTSPVVTVTCLILAFGLSFNQEATCSSRNSIAPGWSFV